MVAQDAIRSEEESTVLCQAHEFCHVQSRCLSLRDDAPRSILASLVSYMNGSRHVVVLGKSHCVVRKKMFDIANTFRVQNEPPSRCSSR